MNISTLFEKDRPVFSVEIFPPKKTAGVMSLYRTLDQLEQIKPDFISVTYGAGGGKAGTQTCELASYIKNQMHIEPLAHLTCVNSTKEQILLEIQELEKNNVENILALRGDIGENSVLDPDMIHASDMTAFIKENSRFNIAGACYPECHFECDNLDQDIENLKKKVDAGASHLITQLFFDNEKFYRFREKVDKAGIKVPIEAGIMPIVNIRQVEKTVALSGASLPGEFTHMVSRYSNSPEALHHAGIAYAIEQIYELLENGVQGVHIYAMNNARVAKEIYEGVKSRLGRE